MCQTQCCACRNSAGQYSPKEANTVFHWCYHLPSWWCAYESRYISVISKMNWTQRRQEKEGDTWCSLMWCTTTTTVLYCSGWYVVQSDVVNNLNYDILIHCTGSLQYSTRMPDPDIMSVFHQYIWLLLRSGAGIFSGLGQKYFLAWGKNL